MIYFLGTNLNKNNKINKEFKKIKGLNIFKIIFICKKIGINYQTFIYKISSIKLNYMLYLFNKYFILDDFLKKSIQQNILLKIQNKTYKGFRFLQNLPVNGQNTKNNKKTAKKLNKI